MGNKDVKVTAMTNLSLFLYMFDDFNCNLEKIIIDKQKTTQSAICNL